MARDVVEEMALHSEMVANYVASLSAFGSTLYWPARDAVTKAVKEIKEENSGLPLDWMAEMARITAERVGTEEAKAIIEFRDPLKTFETLREAFNANLRWWRPRGSHGDLAALEEARKVTEAAGAVGQTLTKAKCLALAIWAALDEDAEKEARSPAAVEARLKEYLANSKT